MPGGPSAGIPNVPKSLPAVKSLRSVPINQRQVFTIAGTTRNASGSALGNCTVDLFRTADDSVAARTQSDANGLYSIVASSEVTHYAVAYLAGAPDVTGATVNTLVGI